VCCGYCAGVTVDILAGGLSAAHLPLWARVAERTGGAVLLQEGFGGLLCHNIAGALRRKQASSVQLDFYASDGLYADQVIGPGLARVGKLPRRHSDAQGSEGPRAAAACNAASLENGSALAVLLQSRGDVQQRHVLLQAVARWTTPNGMPITRV
jgi:hypothetical protein